MPRYWKPLRIPATPCSTNYSRSFKPPSIVVPALRVLDQPTHKQCEKPVRIAAKMDDKKNEDYSIEMGDMKGRSSPTSRDSFLSSKSGSSRGVAPPPAISNITNSPPISILAYCLASISMTLTNKYCVSGPNWNLNFFYLAIQVSPLPPPLNPMEAWDFTDEVFSLSSVL